MDGDPRTGLVMLAVAAALVALRALAAALEAALVAVGQPRAAALAAEPGAGRRARCVAALAADPEGTAAAIRVTETATLVLVGLLAGAAGGRLFPDRVPFLSGLLLAVAAGAVSVVLSAVGRAAGARHGEGMALALSVPARGFRLLLRPLGKLLAAVAVGRARFSQPPPPLDEMERALVEYAKAHGQSSTSELIHAVFQFRELVAKDVMVPRTEVLAVELETPVPEIVRTLAEAGHSRVPVYKDHLDQIVGVLHARDLVPLLAHPDLIVLSDLLRPAHFVPWSKPVEQLLREMQRKKLHLALVVDEFGGVMGLCTIEDVLEQIVGDIQDEFEEDEAKAVEALPDGSFLVHGTTSIGEFNRLARAELPEDQGVETLAGFLNALAGAIPAKGDRFYWRGWVFTVADADPRKVTRVRAARGKRGAGEPPATQTVQVPVTTPVRPAPTVPPTKR